MARRQLQLILSIRGVTGAAVVTTDGRIVESVTRDGFEPAFISTTVATSLASGNMLMELLGQSQPEQTMIEYENGPVLLAQLGDARTHLAVLTLDTAATLGRVRLQLRKLLPELAARLS